MSYFSRLTDIVTCNLSDILAKEKDPSTALRRIVAEMEEGLSGARRSVKAAANNVSELEQELAELRAQIAQWVVRAKQSLADGDESAARAALSRKKEQEDLSAGLEQQLTSAIATHDQLKTTLRALEARLSDARRRESDEGETADQQVESPKSSSSSTTADRSHEIDEELAALKRELGEG